MVHRRDLKGETLVFGNQGALFGNAMTWWDHATGSIWSQPLGEAIAGPLEGESLELFPSTLTTWGAWRETYPETEALDVFGWQTGYDLEMMAIVVDLGTEASAYRVPAVREIGVLNDEVAGVPIAVVIDPADNDRWAVFSRRLDASVVELTMSESGLVDIETGTVFDPFVGTALSGPLENQALDRMSAFTAFPEDYFTFFPDGRMWPG